VLVKSPAFSAAAITTLVLGIGANTAIFSLVKTVMLAPLPYAEPERLVMLWDISSPDDMTWLAAQEIAHYREDAASFERLGGYIEANANLTGGREPERVRAAQVTGELRSSPKPAAVAPRAGFVRWCGAVWSSLSSPARWCSSSRPGSWCARSSSCSASISVSTRPTS
jgi:hypothetical protein